MRRESVLLSRDWQATIERLGGAAGLRESARASKAFSRARGIKSAADLLRLVLAYCLGETGLRSTAAWAAAVGLADISNVALLQRLRCCGDWLSLLVGKALACAPPPAAHGRLIRLIDATVVPQGGLRARKSGKLWRIHAAFDLPHERFSHFELTDQSGGERIDRIPVVAGEIRIGDRAHLQPDRIARVLEASADILVRAAWNGARWLDPQRRSFDLIGALHAADQAELIDQTIFVGRNEGAPLALRLVAVKKSPAACAAARRKARRDAKRHGNTISQATLTAADWVILVTSLDAATFSTNDILALYRLRWRIELGFKRLKSLVGLKGPPGTDERSAKPWLLAHLLIILLLEPSVDELEDSPRWLLAA